jgi:hypothetical protein
MADPAIYDLIAQSDNGFAEPSDRFPILSQQVQDKSQGRFTANTGQSGKFIYGALQKP